MEFMFCGRWRLTKKNRNKTLLENKWDQFQNLINVMERIKQGDVIEWWGGSIWLVVREELSEKVASELGDEWQEPTMRWSWDRVLQRDPKITIFCCTLEIQKYWGKIFPFNLFLQDWTSVHDWRKIDGAQWLLDWWRFHYKFSINQNFVWNRMPISSQDPRTLGFGLVSKRLVIALLEMTRRKIFETAVRGLNREWLSKGSCCSAWFELFCCMTHSKHPRFWWGKVSGNVEENSAQNLYDKLTGRKGCQSIQTVSKSSEASVQDTPRKINSSGSCWLELG